MESFRRRCRQWLASVGSDFRPYRYQIRVRIRCFPLHCWRCSLVSFGWLSRYSRHSRHFCSFLRPPHPRRCHPRMMTWHGRDPWLRHPWLEGHIGLNPNYFYPADHPDPADWFSSAYIFTRAHLGQGGGGLGALRWSCAPASRWFRWPACLWWPCWCTWPPSRSSSGCRARTGPWPRFLRNGKFRKVQQLFATLLLQISFLHDKILVQSVNRWDFLL